MGNAMRTTSRSRSRHPPTLCQLSYTVINCTNAAQQPSHLASPGCHLMPSGRGTTWSNQITHLAGGHLRPPREQPIHRHHGPLTQARLEVSCMVVPDSASEQKAGVIVNSTGAPC